MCVVNYGAVIISHSVTAEGATIGVNRNNLLLRGCVLRNTSTVVGVVVYAGQFNMQLGCVHCIVQRDSYTPSLQGTRPSPC